MINFDYVLFTNLSYMEMTKNAIANLMLCDTQNSIFVYCVDIDCFDLLSKFYKNNFQINIENYSRSGLPRFANNYGSPLYNLLCVQGKIKSILHHIEKHNKPCVYLDSDIVVFNKPVLNNYINYDIVFAPEDFNYVWVCAGFMYINPTEASVSILNDVLLGCKEDKNDQEFICSYLLNNSEIDDVRSFKGAKIGVFDRDNYISGFLFRRSETKSYYEDLVYNKKCIMYHSNYNYGYDEKFNEIKKIGGWII